MRLILKKYGRVLLFLAVGAAVLIGIILVWNARGAPSDSFKEEYALSFSAYDGRSVSLTEFKKKVLIAHTWASWCTFCAQELENLARIKEVYGDEVAIVAINRAEPLGEAKAFSDALELPEGVVLLLDPSDSFFKHIEGFHMPETVFIEPSGTILFHQRGPLSFELAVQKINELMQK